MFESPEALWRACCEYFQWVEDNPLSENKLFVSRGNIREGIIPKMRAMTISGLCLFLDISMKTWTRWRDDNDFCHIVAKAESVIYSQKFSGAAAGLLNSNIIVRELGLVDKSERKGEFDVNVVDMTIDELKKSLIEILSDELTDGISDTVKHTK